MLLHVPDHLQKLFKAFMAVAYDLKKKFPDLKRSVKFDENPLSMFMDLQTKEGSPWKRIQPEQAIRAAASRQNRQDNAPRSLEDADLRELMETEDAEQTTSD